MASRYWIGGSGDWSDTAHWSATSGGSGGASVPTSTDDAYFDTNSGVGTINVEVGTSQSVRDLNSTAFLHQLNLVTPSGGPSTEVVVSRNLTGFWIRGLTVFIRMTGSGSLNVNSGAIYPSSSSSFLTLRIDTPGTITMTGDCDAYSIYVYRGSLVTNGYDLVTNYLGYTSTYNATLRKFDLSGSSVTVKSALWLNKNYTGGVFTTTGATLNIEGYDIDGGNRSLGHVNLVYGDSSTDEVSISGNNTFSTLESERDILFKDSGLASPTTTVITSSLLITGTPSDYISIRSQTPGTKHRFSKATGTVDLYYVDLKDSDATGGATWNANNSIDSGNNTGWNFVGPSLPFANFTGTPLTGYAPLLVNFTDTSTGLPDTWSWNFGDGGTSSSQNPSHTYNSAGTFNVSLTASNSIGSDSETKIAYITITPHQLTAEASGTLLFGGGATRKLKAKREASGTLLFGGSVYGFIRKDTTAVEKKTYLYKVYDEAGNYLDTLADVVSEPSFSQELNELGSSMTVELARNSDSLGQTTTPLQTEAGTTITTEDGFPLLATTTTRNQVGSGSVIQHNYRVDVYAFYGYVEPLLTETGEPILTEDGEPLLATVGYPNGIRVFTGFIADINIRYGDTETTTLLLNSYGFDLDQFPITTSGGNTTVPFLSVDPSTIAKDAIDKFVTDSAGFGTYTTRDSLSIANTGTVVSYTFRANTYGDVLKKTLELMPSDWYFYVGLGDNLVYYRQRASVARHIFVLGRHIKSLDLKSTIADSVNRVLFTGGGEPPLFRNYQETPAANTRRVLQLYSDNRVTTSSGAGIIAEGLIESGNKVKYTTTLDILAETYDIESVNVGDMVRFANFGNYVDGLLMQVVARTYTPDVVTLQLDSLPRTVNKRLEDLKRNLLVKENQDVPVAPS